MQQSKMYLSSIFRKGKNSHSTNFHLWEQNDGLDFGVVFHVPIFEHFPPFLKNFPRMFVKYK